MTSTLVINIGEWGGFYCHWGYTKRLCLGWIAIALLPFDLDILLMKLGEPLEPSCPAVEAFEELSKLIGDLHFEEGDLRNMATEPDRHAVEDDRTDEIIALADTIATTTDEATRHEAYEKLSQVGAETAIDVWNGISPN